MPAYLNRKKPENVPKSDTRTSYIVHTCFGFCFGGGGGGGGLFVVFYIEKIKKRDARNKMKNISYMTVFCYFRLSFDILPWTRVNTRHEHVLVLSL
jgi:hypothetical protein